MAGCHFVLLKLISFALAGECQATASGFLDLERPLGGAPIGEGKEVFDSDEVGYEL